MRYMYDVHSLEIYNQAGRIGGQIRIGEWLRFVHVFPMLERFIKKYGSTS